MCLAALTIWPTCHTAAISGSCLYGAGIRFQRNRALGLGDDAEGGRGDRAQEREEDGRGGRTEGREEHAQGREGERGRRGGAGGARGAR